MLLHAFADDLNLNANGVEVSTVSFTGGELYLVDETPSFLIDEAGNFLVAPGVGTFSADSILLHASADDFNLNAE